MHVFRIVAHSNKASGVAFFHQDCSMQDYGSKVVVVFEDLNSLHSQLEHYPSKT